MAIGIDPTVENPCRRCPEFVLDMPQHRPAGEREVEVETGDLIGCEVFAAAISERGQCDWSVDIVKSDQPTGLTLDKFTDLDPIGDIRADNHEIGIAQRAAPALVQFADAVVEAGHPKGWLRQVAMVAVPRCFAFQEQHLMTAIAQGFYQSPIGCRVPIAPR